MGLKLVIMEALEKNGIIAIHEIGVQWIKPFNICEIFISFWAKKRQHAYKIMRSLRAKQNSGIQFKNILIKYVEMFNKKRTELALSRNCKFCHENKNLVDLEVEGVENVPR